MTALAVRLRALPRDGGRGATNVAFIAAATFLVAALALCINRAHNGDVYLELGAVLYFLTVLAIVHPRGAVFSLAALACLVTLLLRGWPWTLAIPALFAL